MSKSKVQNQRVLDHLIDHGYITQTIATSYGIRRLASRINDLRNETVFVLSERRVDDAGVPYAYYTLDPTTREAEKHRRDVLRFGWRLEDFSNTVIAAAA